MDTRDAIEERKEHLERVLKFISKTLPTNRPSDDVIRKPGTAPEQRGTEKTESSTSTVASEKPGIYLGAALSSPTTRTGGSQSFPKVVMTTLQGRNSKDASEESNLLGRVPNWEREAIEIMGAGERVCLRLTLLLLLLHELFRVLMAGSA